MLRLKSIEPVRQTLKPFSADEAPSPEAVDVTFTGPAGDFADCTITVTLRRRENDQELLAAAEEEVRRAVAALARDHGSPKSE